MMEAPSKWKPSFGETMKLLRKAEGYTQMRLANALGVDRTTIAKYETDDREPDLKTLCRIADLFGVTTDELLGRD
ncbi:MAG: helix-turn-helix domain-containing protein [Clostridiales bacterium]|jgi:transcriptional regulator with XRE-family HTH domain|nr:helix-turn-helix domain-containing protein [Clostridiales bacterium]